MKKYFLLFWVFLSQLILLDGLYGQLPIIASSKIKEEFKRLNKLTLTLKQNLIANQKQLKSYKEKIKDLNRILENGKMIDKKIIEELRIKLKNYMKLSRDLKKQNQEISAQLIKLKKVIKELNSSSGWYLVTGLILGVIAGILVKAGIDIIGG